MTETSMDTLDVTTPGDDLLQSDGLPVEHEVGTQVDKYVILERLGQGGMGVVYKAYDPELDRRVALKFLSVSEGEGTTDAGANVRLLREAQALAQLSHPNVVAVYGVGTFDKQVFMAMEYVEGQTLRQWLKSSQRTPNEILEVMIPAGQGLAAAHLAGLIHRDFKPENVLIGNDSRVRVLDFGLARAGSASDLPATQVFDSANEKSADDLLSEQSSERLLSTPITRAGSLMGTPVYMSPEQYLGLEVDAAVDQFSFCVTLYEALVGQRPFSGRGRKELMANITAGRVQPLAGDASVPDWLMRAVRQGIMPSRQDRFGDMQTLLEVLQNDPLEAQRLARAAQRRTILGALLGLGFACAVFAAWVVFGTAAGICQGASKKVEPVWNPSVEKTINAAFLQTGHAQARPNWMKVRTIVADYLAGWTVMHGDTCEATHMRKEQSEALLDLRMTCLDRHLREVKALLEVFADADAVLVDRSVMDAQKLGHLSACQNTEALQMQAGTKEGLFDPKLQGQVDDLAVQIAKVEALEKTGRLQQGADLATKTLAKADQIGYRPMQAEARYHLASILERLSRWQEAEAHVGQGLFLADASGHEVYRAKSANLYALLLGYRYQRFGQARRMELQARAAIERLGNDERLLSDWHNHVSLNRIWAKEYEQALKHNEKAHQISLKLYGPDHPRIAADVNNVGVVHLKRGDYDQAISALAKATKLWEKALGSDNVRVASGVLNLGNCYKGKGDFSAALKYYQRALAIRVNNHGSEHMSVATLYHEIGTVHMGLQAPIRAQEHFQKAIRIFESLGDREMRTMSVVGLAEALLVQKRFVEAKQQLKRVLEICMKVVCTTTKTAENLFKGARFLRGHDRWEHLAVRLAQVALTIFRSLPNEAENAQEIETWLRQGSGSRPNASKTRH